MIKCTFLLNDQPMSLFDLGGRSFPAFSGLGVHVNRRSSSCVADQGPIPIGEYFLLDRESGGRLGKIYDALNGRRDWFALYADDGRVDDKTWCEQVERGAFRLHPKGPLGISQGCIVINEPSEFSQLRLILRARAPFKIPGSELTAWSKVIVK
ncbi:DUF2778 domain-containing protein [Lampropedia aestuarii]|uniref:DUF2778 domain-containing protein n=2 Tax=Lampropedia aestuarii TaxID=2562762 RepID=A0A4S5BYR8_9BURK|nr:DUF2778 domain-containing protein [Lampropedia aestuarii]